VRLKREERKENSRKLRRRKGWKRKEEESVKEKGKGKKSYLLYEKVFKLLVNILGFLVESFLSLRMSCKVK
jgi:hypothetical protein